MEGDVARRQRAVERTVDRRRDRKPLRYKGLLSEQRTIEREDRGP
jgi:hypothetical protein